MNLNGENLSYIGDAYFELLVREDLLKTISKNEILHKTAKLYTSGKMQALYIHYLIDNSLLSEEELKYFKKGRNTNNSHKRKNISIREHKESTGFESLIGYLYLENNKERIFELYNMMKKWVVNSAK